MSDSNQRNDTAEIARLLSDVGRKIGLEGWHGRVLFLRAVLEYLDRVERERDQLQARIAELEYQLQQDPEVVRRWLHRESEKVSDVLVEWKDMRRERDALQARIDRALKYHLEHAEWDPGDCCDLMVSALRGEGEEAGE